MASDLAAGNINVYAIAPGLFQSKMTEQLLDDETTTIGGDTT
jgi:NAD(P)-dependent dehydrogenase (short-subunit alcohol dehydrogenase family)